MAHRLDIGQSFAKETMQNYKAPDNTLHVIEPKFAHLLPKGCIPITDEEASSLLIKPELTPAEQLAKLDAEYAITQRNLRETIMLMAEGFKQLTGGALDLTQLPGVAKVYEVEAKAQALRAEL